VSRISDTFFAGLIRKLAPTATEISQIQQHINTVQSTIKNKYNVKRYMVIGSHSRQSAIRNHSDVDLFAVFAREDATWGDNLIKSDTALANLRQALTTRYWNTDIGRDGQAIVVSFSGVSVDVVPGVFWGWSKQSRPVYLMPDGKGWWRQTSPESHNKYIETASATSRHKLKYVAQMLKFWRICRSPMIPIKSFHIEMLLASQGTTVGIKSYGECLRDTFGVLWQRKCAGLQDPLGISGIIECCGSGPQTARALQAIGESYDQAQRACQAEINNNYTEAKRLWSLVFNNKA
jgi:predicted nucleotidyltransferase